MFRTDHSLPIALVDGDIFRRTFLRQQLDVMNHANLAFESIDDLLLAQRTGRRFGLLIVAVQHAMTLFSIREALEASTGTKLLLMQDNTSEASKLFGDCFIESKNVETILHSSSAREFDLKVQWLMRETPQLEKDPDELVFAAYKFDKRSGVVWNDDEIVKMRPQEFSLALELFQGLGQILSREKLSFAMNPEASYSSESRTLDVYVSRVRKKLELTHENGFSLRSIYRRGYVLNSWAASTRSGLVGLRLSDGEIKNGLSDGRNIDI